MLNSVSSSQETDKRITCPHSWIFRNDVETQRNAEEAHHQDIRFGVKKSALIVKRWMMEHSYL